MSLLAFQPVASQPMDKDGQSPGAPRSGAPEQSSKKINSQWALKRIFWWLWF